jgi:hypothetical protein
LNKIGENIDNLGGMILPEEFTRVASAALNGNYRFRSDDYHHWHVCDPGQGEAIERETLCKETGPFEYTLSALSNQQVCKRCLRSAKLRRVIVLY